MDREYVKITLDNNNKVKGIATSYCGDTTIAKEMLGFSVGKATITRQVRKALNETSGSQGGYAVAQQGSKKVKKKAKKDEDEEVDLEEAEEEGDTKGKEKEDEEEIDDMEEKDMEGEEEKEEGDDKEVDMEEAEEEGDTEGKHEEAEEETDEDEEVEKGEKGDKKEPYNGQDQKDTTELPDEPLPSAQILANLYSHLKGALKYIEDENPRHEHDDIKGFLENHRDDIAGHMEEYKNLMKHNHPNQDIDEMSKAIEGPAAASETEPDANLEGEEGMVAEGAVPPEDAEMEQSPEETEEAPKAEGKEPEAEEMKGEEPVEDVTTEETVETPEGDETEIDEDKVVDKGQDMEEIPEEDDNNDMTTKAVDEILERYRHPKSQKWETRKRYIQNGKLLPPGQKPVKKSMPKAHDLSREAYDTIRQAGQHMYDLSRAPDLPPHHRAGLDHHSGKIGDICMKMEGGMKNNLPQKPMEEQMPDEKKACMKEEGMDMEGKPDKIEEKGPSAHDLPEKLRHVSASEKDNSEPVSKEVAEEYAAIRKLLERNGMKV